MKCRYWNSVHFHTKSNHWIPTSGTNRTECYNFIVTCTYLLLPVTCNEEIHNPMMLLWWQASEKILFHIWITHVSLRLVCGPFVCWLGGILWNSRTVVEHQPSTCSTITWVDCEVKRLCQTIACCWTSHRVNIDNNCITWLSYSK